ncbi:type II secretion system protein GspM [Psychrobacter sp. DM8]|uniref:type II secretion system protein GspM n=1 Tax=unclassified Psychrobacter TaxID=196806 RepID=UPI003F507657
MKLMQRRSKDKPLDQSTVDQSTLDSNRLIDRVSRYQNGIGTRWQALSSRDQLALMILSLFLLLFVGGYGGYTLHQMAKDSKENYQEQIADYFWLRAQAGNIDSNALISNSAQGEALPPASRVTTLLSGAGIRDAQVAAVGESVQISFMNASQAVVSAALSQLTQQGWQFTQMTMEQDETSKAITVQATMTL